METTQNYQQKPDEEKLRRVYDLMFSRSIQGISTTGIPKNVVEQQTYNLRDKFVRSMN